MDPSWDSCPYCEAEQRDGTRRQLSYPANAKTASERLRAIDQLKTDGLISEEEYNSKRKEILGEL